MAKAKQQELTIEEKLEKALVPEDEQPYEVPSNWVWTRVWSILSEIKNGTTTKQNKEFIGAKVTRIESIQNNKIDFNRVGYIAELESIKDSDWYIAHDIAFSHINSAEHVGKTAIIYEDLLPLVHGMNLLRLRLNKACISKYFYYFSQSFQYKQSILERINMAVNQVSINQKQVGDIELPIPPLAEQQRIVDRIESLFEKLDNAKELAQNALDTFETRKAAILHKAFTGELTAKWREKNGVGMDSWKECCWSKVADTVKDKYDPSCETSDLPYIGLEHIEKGNGIISVGKAEEVKSLKTLFKSGDILYGKLRPYLNKHDIVEFDGMCSTDILAFRTKNLKTAKYLNYYLDTTPFINYAVSNSKGINLPRVSEKEIANFILNMPTLSEQQEIVSILDELFEKERKAKELYDVIDKIDIMKKAILARAFRGELGTNDPSEESAVELLKECLM